MKPGRYQQVMEMFLAASRLTGQQRQQFLDQHCGEDEDLRREVESLLDHHRQETVSTKPRADAPTRKATTAGMRPIMKVHLPDIVPTSALRTLVAAFILTASLGVVGFWLRYQIHNAMQENVSDHLESVRAANVLALREWVTEKQFEVVSWAHDAEVRRHVVSLAEYFSSVTPSAAQLQASPDHLRLLAMFRPVYRREGSYGVGVVSRDGVNLVHNVKDLVGQTLTPDGSSYLRRVLDDETILATPSVESAYSVGFPLNQDDPVMAVATAVCDQTERPVAALAFAFSANDEFADLLSSSGLGATAETFIVDDKGLLLSNLKDVQPLRDAGLIGPQEQPALRVTLRDPGGPRTAGHGAPRPNNSSELPLTLLARSVAVGESGFNIEGYRNVLGQRVVGAWRWLPDYGFAVATEMTFQEAFAPLQYVKKAFLLLFLILVLLVAALVFSSGSVLRMRKHADAARKLGQYTLETLIGQGGMGKVYLARHAMLRRPTAVKLLEGKHADPRTVERFEREVQLTSQLTHPNTIQIYDYGRTPEQTFYYAMEFLDGLNLAELVALAGKLPPARVVHLLRQVCGSLQEAHASGLIHRDIKPANIMLCRLWGQNDVVKVLDFGLVKQMAIPSHGDATRIDEISGTPRYMAPERLSDPDHVDARSDLYSLGAVAFFVSTGTELYSGSSPMQILARSLASPLPQNQAAALESVPVPLRDLILGCLQPLPENRPRNVAEVIRTLDELSVQHPWTTAESTEWWQQYHPRDSH